MNPFQNIIFHESQFPEAVSRQLHRDLIRRSISSRFHYQSYRQSARWLELHESYCPVYSEEANAAKIYHSAYATLSEQLQYADLRVISLCTGEATKDVWAIENYTKKADRVAYYPIDSSVPLLLFASQKLRSRWPLLRIKPLAVDILSEGDFSAHWEEDESADRDAVQVFSLLGSLHNFQPDEVMSRIRKIMRPHDWLILSANLVPSTSYFSAIDGILRQYENPLTQAWLECFLEDLGVSVSGKEWTFRIRTCPELPGLRGIQAQVRWLAGEEFSLQGQVYRFAEGESLELFYSYRYHSGLVLDLLRRHSFEVRGEWLAGNQEEGVWLVQAGAEVS